MSHLNYEFFDAFKALDNLCRDLYSESPDKKLGVTLYLEDMDSQDRQDTLNVPNWAYDYKQLKSARATRNELAHSRDSITVDICSREDIDFVQSFRKRILNQTDPLAMLRKLSTRRRPSAPKKTKHNPQPSYTYTIPPRTSKPVGCLGIVALFLIVIACCIALF